MAVDTRNRRASAIGLGLAFVAVLPLADGTIGAADRQQVAMCYASSAVGVVDGDEITVSDGRFARTLTSRDGRFARAITTDNGER